jgi:hypothetical protein
LPQLKRGSILSSQANITGYKAVWWENEQVRP